jgi:hypothetical protein
MIFTGQDILILNSAHSKEGSARHGNTSKGFVIVGLLVQENLGNLNYFSHYINYE